MGHASKARAIPVDLTGLRVECGLLTSFLLELLGVQSTLKSSGLALLGLRGSPFLPNLGSNGVEGLGLGIIASLFANGSKDGDYSEQEKELATISDLRPQ